MEEKLIKIINYIFWMVLIAMIIFWYFQNNDKFFPDEKLEKILREVFVRGLKF